MADQVTEQAQHEATARQLAQLARVLFRDRPADKAEAELLAALTAATAQQAEALKRAQSEIASFNKRRQSVPDDDPRWEAWARESGIPMQDYRTLMHAYDFTYHTESGVLAALVAGDQGYEDVPSFTFTQMAQAQLAQQAEEIARLRGALQEWRADHKGCRPASWGDNRCDLCVRTDAALSEGTRT